MRYASAKTVQLCCNSNCKLSMMWVACRRQLASQAGSTLLTDATPSMNDTSRFASSPPPTVVAISVGGMFDDPQAITYNKQLREQIDNLRRERLMFEAINGNLDKELARIKRSIAGVFCCWANGPTASGTSTRHHKIPLCVSQEDSVALCGSH